VPSQINIVDVARWSASKSSVEINGGMAEWKDVCNASSIVVVQSLLHISV
jgi:hypothetical protein